MNLSGSPSPSSPTGQSGSYIGNDARQQQRFDAAFDTFIPALSGSRQIIALSIPERRSDCTCSPDKLAATQLQLWYLPALEPPLHPSLPRLPPLLCDPPPKLYRSKAAIPSLPATPPPHLWDSSKRISWDGRFEPRLLYLLSFREFSPKPDKPHLSRPSSPGDVF
jgi:hypothetical protein